MCSVFNVLFRGNVVIVREARCPAGRMEVSVLLCMPYYWCLMCLGGGGWPGWKDVFTE